MRRRYTAIERAHLLAVSTLIDPGMKMAFSNQEAARQAEQWIIQEARDTIEAKPLLLVHKMIIQKAVMSKVHPVCGIFLIKRS